MFGCCKSCSIANHGLDREDFAGFLAPALAAEGYGLLAVCEECGPVLVDGDGKRIASRPEVRACDA